jgi:hypothetical protein
MQLILMPSAFLSRKESRQKQVGTPDRGRWAIKIEFQEVAAIF